MFRLGLWKSSSVWVSSALIWFAHAGQAQNLVEIVRRSVQLDQANFEAVQNYTYLRESATRELDSAGKVTNTERTTHEILFLYGERYARLVARDGKPLPPHEEQREKERLRKLTEERRSESPEQRNRRIEKVNKSRRDQRDFAQEIPDAYNLKLIGEETLSGRKAWIIDADPKPGYKPRTTRAEILTKFKARMWVDQITHQWLRMRAEALDTVSFGLFLVRLSKGAQVSFDQTLVNGEAWLPQNLHLRFDVRLGLIKHIRREIEQTMSNYRKFQADSHVVSAWDQP